MKYLILAAIIAVAGVAGTIHPVLQNQMNVIEPGELIPVFINITGRIDRDYVEIATLGMSWDERRTFVVDALKSKADETQQGVLEVLKSSGADQVENLQTFWLVNSVFCYACADVINEIASREDVNHIAFGGALYEGLGLIEPTDVHPSTPEELGRANAWGVDQINAPAVWAMGYEGNGIIVAIVDTGVNYNHVDLVSNMWHDTPGGFHYGWDFYDGDNDPMDDYGHGTHCAGSVASDGTAGTVCGVAPSATIMALRINYYLGGESTWIEAFEFATDHGAHVVSTSLGSPNSSLYATFRTAEENLLTAGLHHSIAAGNNGPGAETILCPGICPPPWIHPDQLGTGGLTSVVTAGATDNSDIIAGFSSRGPTDVWGTIAPWNDWSDTGGLLDPDISGPGVDVVSCTWPDNNSYTTMSGTSMATPHIAGVMALILDVNTGLSQAKVDSLMEVTSLDLGSAGKDNTYGAGRVDAYQSVLGAISVSIGETTGFAISPGLILSPVYPNPVCSMALFDISIDLTGTIDISVFDLAGRKAAIIHSGTLPAGSNSFSWRIPESMSNGIYFVSASSGNESTIRRMAVLR